MIDLRFRAWTPGRTSLSRIQIGQMLAKEFEGIAVEEIHEELEKVGKIGLKPRVCSVPYVENGALPARSGAVI